MKILLGICGSIAAYKTYDLARGLQKEGHEVKIILTKGACEFVSHKMYNYLGIEEVYVHDADFNFEGPGILHIELAKWAEHFCIFPASANTISNLAFGKADDLLTATFLAKPEQLITSIFPAMNTQMYLHPITKENINLLERITISKNVFIHPPASGELACGDIGIGKAPDISKVINCIDAINPNLTSNSPLCLITTGATISPVDPVRFMTNSSSGLTGYEFAKTALRSGYQVIVVAGKYATDKLDDLSMLPGFKLIRITTTNDMKSVVDSYFKDCSIYISSAAVCDIEFDSAPAKLKKKNMGTSLEFSEACDILKSVIDIKHDKQVIIGFAAETDLSMEVLLEKYNRKPVDFLIGTKVHGGLSGNQQTQGFNTDSAYYKVLKGNTLIIDEVITKKELPNIIFNKVLNND